MPGPLTETVAPHAGGGAAPRLRYRHAPLPKHWYVPWVLAPGALLGALWIAQRQVAVFALLALLVIAAVLAWAAAFVEVARLTLDPRAGTLVLDRVRFSRRRDTVTLDLAAVTEVERECWTPPGATGVQAYRLRLVVAGGSPVPVTTTRFPVYGDDEARWHERDRLAAFLTRGRTAAGLA